MEHPVLNGIHYRLNEVKVVVEGVPQGRIAHALRSLANFEIRPNIVTHSVSTPGDGRSDITFICARTSAAALMNCLEAVKADIDFAGARCNDSVGRLYLVGTGLRSQPGVIAAFCEALASRQVNIDLISTSDTGITALVEPADLGHAIDALLHRFARSGPLPVVDADTSDAQSA